MHVQSCCFAYCFFAVLVAVVAVCLQAAYKQIQMLPKLAYMFLFFLASHQSCQSQHRPLQWRRDRG